MSDKSVRIIRPVALPRKFLGAPMEPAAMSITAFVVGALYCFATKDYALLGIVLFVLMIPAHVAIMWAGFKNPHIGTLMSTFHQTMRTARSMGRQRGKYFPAG